MGRERSIDVAGLQRLREQLGHGKSLTHMATELGVSYKTVQLAAKRLGVRAASRPRPIYGPEVRAEAIRLYKSGLTTGEISRKLGPSDSWVQSQLKAAGVICRPSGKLAGLTSEVVRRYAAGESTADLAEAYQVSDSTICNHLAAAGLKVRRAGWAARKYDLRDDAFSSLVSGGASDEAAAYWAGFLMADGTVSDSGRITLALAAKDEAHIFEWLTFMGCPQVRISHDNVVLEGKVHQKVRAQIGSQQVAADLSMLGIVPRKTLAGIPASPTLAQNPAFWRGVIDGDGTIALPKGKYGPTLALVGSECLMEQYANFLSETIAGKRPRVLRVGKSSIIVQVRVQGVRAREALLEIWRSTDGSQKHPALRRKLTRAQVCMEWSTAVEKALASFVDARSCDG